MSRIRTEACLVALGLLGCITLVAGCWTTQRDTRYHGTKASANPLTHWEENWPNKRVASREVPDGGTITVRTTAGERGGIAPGIQIVYKRGPLWNQKRFSQWHAAPMYSGHQLEVRVAEGERAWLVDRNLSKVIFSLDFRNDEYWGIWETNHPSWATVE